MITHGDGENRSTMEILEHNKIQSLTDDRHSKYDNKNVNNFQSRVIDSLPATSP